MSEPILPPSNTLIPHDRGLSAWKPMYEHIAIEKLPAGARALKVAVDGVFLFDRILSSDQAAHLARLLTS